MNSRPLRSLPGIRHAARAGRAFAGALRRRAPRGVVLLYHRIAGPRRDPQWLDVTPEHFELQLGVLARDATPLPLDEFESRRRAGRLPRRAVAVTFDDGYADNLHAAAPALVRHGIAATVFVTAGMVGSDREFWWDDIERIAFAPTLAAGEVTGTAMRWSPADAAQAPPAPDADTWTMLSAVDPTARHRLYRALAATLHPLATPLREARLSAWRAWAAVPTGARASHRPLTLEELRALAAVPGISVGAHTLTHPSLAMLAAEDQAREITGSREWLERTLGSPVRAFAYPFGTATDVSSTSVRTASAVYAYAMATTPLPAWRWSPRWRLPRAIVRDWDADTFAARLDALFGE
jgi:peptidoglycan/xylan/chitin deacetylase (PgdA/CDA1 family)